MSLGEIEAHLEKLSADELRELAMKSWTAFVAKEDGSGGANQCHEDDPELLGAIDDALAQAEAAPLQGHTADEARTRIGEWASR